MCAIMGFTSPSLTAQTVRPFFDRTLSRGPDQSRIEPAGTGQLCFHRLAIMGLQEEGMQPFHLGGDMVVCNGELYGFRPLKRELEQRGQPVDYQQLLEEITQRDYADSHRAAAPLKQAEDAVLLDTSALDFDASLEALLAIVKERVPL